MKSVIDGLLYDTDTAAEICELVCSTTSSSDFRWHESSLYRTAKGRFFVAGKGGPMSMWRESTSQNSWSSGKGLLAISEGEARTHMEQAGCTAESFMAAGLGIEDA